MKFTGRWALLGAVLLVLGACADETPPGGDTANNSAANNSAANNSASNNAPTNNAPGNNAPANNAPGNNNPVAKVGFGEPCRSNLGCESGFCIASPQGFVCTEACTSAASCPELGGEAMGCEVTANFGADGVRICVPTTSSLCAPCFQDGSCFGGLCVPTSTGSVCGVDCEEDADCPGETVCFRFAPTGEALAKPQCLPANLSCGCDAATAGQTRPCVQLGDGGNRCFGEEICDPEGGGWVGCDAAIPTLEVCDGEDNDCNGAIDDGLAINTRCTVSNALGECAGVLVCEGEGGARCVAPTPEVEACDLRDNDCDDAVDEDFKDAAGVLSTVEHCGSCGNACAARLPLAAEVACEAEGGVASCVVVSCRPGYVRSGPTTCLPLASRLCEPCADDAGCNVEVGDRCVDYGDGQRFCGRSCGADSPFGATCPAGYACNPDGQCQLESGTCLCGPGDDFIRSCTIPDPLDPAVSCVGTLRCEDGALSACAPPQEVCNGVDDDCNGTTDDGLLDPGTGRYVTDAHCGRCYNDCGLLFEDPSYHGRGVCTGLAAAERGELPTCGLACDAGYVDVNGTTVDGCECFIQTPGQDAPDRDGQDADCDGIDGQIARGVFVAPTGEDSAAGTIDAPLRTIQAGIDRAGGGRDHVYVAAGVYQESITLRGGVSVFGGYAADFRRRDLAGNETAIFGRAATEARRGAVNALDLRGAGGAVIFAGFTVVGADNDAPGGSSYALYVRDSDAALTLEDNVIRAGNGGPGQRGTSGGGGAAAPDAATQGATQRLATSRQCPTNASNRSAGGAGGQHMCPDQQGNLIDASGGGGGTADCPTYNEAEPGGAAGQSPPRRGGGGAGGTSALLVEDFFNARCLCQIPSVAGSTGPGVPGADGLTGDAGEFGRGCAASPGRVVNGEWIAGAARSNPNMTFQPESGRGGDGWRGLPGGGGGGGGAGAGIEVQSSNQYFNCGGFTEALGGGGGGGGAGGCGGTGGNGGSPGGGSFGIFAYFTGAAASLPQVRGNRIERAAGGDGGDGGSGGDGGRGALGRIGQALRDDQLAGLLACADPGGRGGDGGDGGGGGGGGGGCGGASVGIYVSGAGGLSTGPYRTQNTFAATGRAGLGGAGGPSTGANGSAGAAGAYQEVVP